jgi:hypothetical protein
MTQDTERRGEPVLVHREHGHVFNPPLRGTIEWGSDERGYSVCTEPAGARFQVQAKDFDPDPGGSRPLWERRRAEDGETVRKAAQERVTRAEREVLYAAMVHEGLRVADDKTMGLSEACAALDAAEKRLMAVKLLGARTVTGCPDGGACHHQCATGCFRVEHCEPLSGVFPGNTWPK